MAFKLSKPMQTTLIVAGLAVAAYLIWKWYQNNQSSNNGTTDNGSGEGTNLNSSLPEITAGGQGNSGLDYMAGSTNITVTQPTPSAVTTTSGGANPAGSTSTTTSGTTTTTAPSTPKVPSVVGMDFGKAYNTLTVAGYKVSPGAGGANASYLVSGQSVKAGTALAKGSTVKLTVSNKS